jgi:hypothetical protein
MSSNITKPELPGRKAGWTGNESEEAQTFLLTGGFLGFFCCI